MSFFLFMFPYGRRECALLQVCFRFKVNLDFFFQMDMLLVLGVTKMMINQL